MPEPWLEAAVPREIMSWCCDLTSGFASLQSGLLLHSFYFRGFSWVSKREGTEWGRQIMGLPLPVHPLPVSTTPSWKVFGRCEPPKEKEQGQQPDHGFAAGQPMPPPQPSLCNPLWHSGLPCFIWWCTWSLIPDLEKWKRRESLTLHFAFPF